MGTVHVDIAGKNVIVTAAGNGMGLAMVSRFRRAGAAGIICADIDLDAAQVAADQVDGVAIGCDVSDEASLNAMVDKARAAIGSIDVFCSHAGYGDSNTTGLSLDSDGFRRMFELNVMAHVWAAKAVVPEMVERGGGYLVQTLSATALITGPAGPGYAITKHGALGFAEWLSLNYGHLGVRVSCLCPNAVYTASWGASTDDVLNASAPPADIGFGEMVRASDVADLVVEAMADERFLILPHPRVGDSFARKANDYDGWLKRTRERLHRPRPE
jgi:NAD(P)-dependent dehydrogenase (short-subunit alcohol dehydrogenase family)